MIHKDPITGLPLVSSASQVNSNGMPMASIQDGDKNLNVPAVAVLALGPGALQQIRQVVREELAFVADALGEEQDEDLPDNVLKLHNGKR